MAARGVVGLCGGGYARADQRRIRAHGMPHAVIAHDPEGLLRPGRAGRRAPAPGKGLESASTWRSEATHAAERSTSTKACGAWPGRLRGRAGGRRSFEVVGARLRRQAQHPARADLDRGARHRAPARLRPRPRRCWRAEARRRAPFQRPRRPRGDRPNTPSRRYAGWSTAARSDLFGICLGHQLLALRTGRPHHARWSKATTARTTR